MLSSSNVASPHFCWFLVQPRNVVFSASNWSLDLPCRILEMCALLMRGITSTANQSSVPHYWKTTENVLTRSKEEEMYMFLQTKNCSGNVCRKKVASVFCSLKAMSTIFQCLCTEIEQLLFRPELSQKLIWTQKLVVAHSLEKRLRQIAVTL